MEELADWLKNVSQKLLRFANQPTRVTQPTVGFRLPGARNTTAPDSSRTAINSCYSSVAAVTTRAENKRKTKMRTVWTKTKKKGAHHSLSEKNKKCEKMKNKTIILPRYTCNIRNV